jgi:excinuclease ABC subunit A
MFSEKNACADCGISFDALLARNFSFNSPYGACPKCDGLGQMLVFDEDLVVPDPTKSIDAGAIAAWRPAGRREAIYRKGLLRALAKYLGFDLATPWEELPQKIRDVVLHGSARKSRVGLLDARGVAEVPQALRGVIPNLQRRYAETDSDYISTSWRIHEPLPCTACGGKRLKRKAWRARSRQGHHGGHGALARDAAEWFANLPLTEQEGKIAAEVLKEIRQRLKFLCDVGLGYLNLDRESGTLSGGEAQRIRLATQVGAGLVGVLYVLDEPSIGLHQRDNRRLLDTLEQLRDLGNIVVVVEHDEDTIREADYSSTWGRRRACTAERSSSPGRCRSC